MRYCLVLAFVLANTHLTAQVTVDDCAHCHPAETALHQTSRMARAMLPANATAFWRHLPDQPLHESGNGYNIRFRPAGNRILITATTARGDLQAEGAIDWILGAGAQGQTPLVRTATGDILESRVSYFSQLDQYGITIGQSGGASTDAVRALGLRHSDHDTKECIACHATAVNRQFEPVIPGIQCIRCHAGAAEHAADPAGRHPVNPGRMKPAAQVRFCGTCHRLQAPVGDVELENVRFQPLRLSKSRCFRSDELSCTTCHPAHQDAKRASAGFYNDKCKACHQSETAPRHAVADSRARGNCIGCHMPYVELHPGLHFTDHFIRVLRAGDLPPETIKVRPDGPVE